MNYRICLFNELHLFFSIFLLLVTMSPWEKNNGHHNDNMQWNARENSAEPHVIAGSLRNNVGDIEVIPWDTVTFYDSDLFLQ